MPKQHLSDRFIKAANTNSRTEYYDQHLIDPDTNTLKRAGVKGLALRVTAAGSKSFVYRYWYNGKSKRYKIGNYPNVSLSEARDRAKELARNVNDGIDPQAQKNKRKYQPKEKTFRELAEKFTLRHLPTLRESTRQEYQRIIDNELIPKFKGMQISDITEHHIRDLLDSKAYGKGSQKPAPTMANRIRAVLSKMFDFAITKLGLGIGVNPVHNTSSYKEGKNKRDRYYDEAEIKRLWKAFEQESEPIRSVLKMLLLTAQRKTETMQMRWQDIEGGVWTIPAAQAKNKQAHQVPLTAMALTIIDDIRPVTGNSDYVFEAKQLENEPIGWIKQAVSRIRNLSKVEDFRIHDLRRTAATHMAEGGVDPMIIGKVLNHKELAQEHRITAIYNRHDYMDKKRQALERWSYKLQQILEPKEANVTKIS